MDLEQAAFLGWLLERRGWFPGQIAADLASGFSFSVWSGHCPFEYSTSHCHVGTDKISRKCPSSCFQPHPIRLPMLGASILSQCPYCSHQFLLDIPKSNSLFYSLHSSSPQLLGQEGQEFPTFPCGIFSSDGGASIKASWYLQGTNFSTRRRTLTSWVPLAGA